jgi:hypothetical protein
MSDLLNSASLVLIPSGYKEDTVYSVVPSDGSGDLSFTRASNGTRVNSAGLVEDCPWNLLTYSEDFTNAAWLQGSGGGASNPTITANTTTAPNGTTTADTIVFPSVSGSQFSLIYRIPSVVGSYTTSVYLKGASGGEIIWMCWTADGVNYLRKQLTLTTNWERYDFTANVPNTSAGIEFGIDLRDSQQSARPSQTVYFWGAQLNIGSTAKPYFPTTDRLNVPRLTYQNGGGGCPSLLLEKQSTNLALYSEQFDDAYWIKQNLTVTANSIVSPDGTQNADLLTLNTLNAEHNVYAPAAGLVITSNAPFTFSCYVKKGTGRYFCTATYFTGVGFGPYATFDLNTATLVASGASFGTYSSSKIESVGNDWYRCSVTGFGPYISLIFAPDIRSASSLVPGVPFTGAGETMYLWGAQLEASSYPTSLINTTASSATRVADACYKTGISSLIGQSEGVLYTDFVCNGFQDFGTPLCVNDGSTSNSIWLTTFANGTLRGEVFGSGSVQASFSMSGGVVGQRYKMALAYKANDFAMYVNGVQIGTDLLGSIPSNLSRVDYDYANPAVYSLSLLQINESVLFKTRLTNSELASLTTI